MKALCVNYNTPDLLDRMLSGFRKYYDIEMLLIDGSDSRYYPQVKRVVEKYTGIEVHHFKYNIHHGPGLAYGFRRIPDERIIVIDSDIVFIRSGIIERMNEDLLSENYGIGDVVAVDRLGCLKVGGIQYLHPAFMLVNKNVVMRWPMPIRHGAPMIETMIKIHETNNDILQHAQYVADDVCNSKNVYISHDWNGTVSRAGSYHLSGSRYIFLAREKMKKIAKFLRGKRGTLLTY